MARFDDKVVVITGASRGIGEAMALAFAAEGAILALCGRSAARMQETADKVTALGAKVSLFEIEVSNAESVVAGFKAIEKELGAADVLVNNAGITKDTLMLRMSESDWDDVLDINLKGAFLCTKSAMRGMMKKRKGAIVNISSVVALMGNAGQANYTASKAGLIGLTKTTARELASRGIRANAIAPGFIETKMTDELSEDIQNKMKDAIPLSRFGKPEEIANVALFLASDDTSYITKQVLSTCSGMVMS